MGIKLHAADAHSSLQPNVSERTPLKDYVPTTAVTGSTRRNGGFSLRNIRVDSRGKLISAVGNVPPSFSEYVEAQRTGAYCNHFRKYVGRSAAASTYNEEEYW